MADMRRGQFANEGLTLSYLNAGEGQALVALPSHWMEAVTYAPLAAALVPGWRVVALDQRGHGYSDHAPRHGGYTRAAYLSDLAALYRHLGLDDAVLLGNSLGGVNAYQFAARYPARVRALIIEDIGAVVSDDTSFSLDWVGVFASREALVACVGPRFLPYLEDAFRETGAGWGLAFDPRDTVASQDALNGDHWADWLGSECPALLIRGRQSRVTKPDLLEEMASRRPNTSLVMLDGGHVVHVDNPVGFTSVVKAFLQRL